MAVKDYWHKMPGSLDWCKQIEGYEVRVVRGFARGEMIAVVLKTGDLSPRDRKTFKDVVTVKADKTSETVSALTQAQKWGDEILDGIRKKEEQRKAMAFKAVRKKQ